MNNYNVDWVNEWDKEKLHKKIFDGLGIIYSFIYLYWILIAVVCINVYLFYLFTQTFNYIYPILGIVILALGTKVHGGQGIHL